MTAKQDLAGRRFDRLSVVSEAGRTNSGKVTWHCVCDCGKKTVTVGVSLTTGNTRSCGCWEIEQRGKGLTKHGHASGGKFSPTYMSWTGMFNRCVRPKSTAYAYYGGRGIKVCERWQGDDGFANFLTDMGERPAGKTLDRYPDNNGNYELGNCRWATPLEQARNRRRKTPARKMA